MIWGTGIPVLSLAIILFLLIRTLFKKTSSLGALLVFTEPYSEARYKFQFTMPAYGEAFDGTFKPITPGTYDLYIDTGWSGSSQRVAVAPPAAPTLSINGVAVNDSALAPIVSNGVMLLPMRALAESFGWYVRWNAAHKPHSFQRSLIRRESTQEAVACRRYG
ncbi:stalk domain-containing protein [Paenibacillus methanolicus]|uniref:stalk domain-containing protein n=1 Tax=Paenibacillus methanolicus TaxID=582686 RepID=UPI0011E693F0|nr:hypothetical protein [Paenibacillus methanolicus]